MQVDEAVHGREIGDVPGKTAAADAARTLVTLLQSAGDAAGVGAFVETLRGPQRTHWSSTLYTVLGLPRTTAPSRRSLLAAFPPTVAAILGESFERLDEHASAIDVEVPLRHGHAGAEWVRVSLRARFEGGHCVEIAGTVQDIAARKRLEVEAASVAHAERERIGAELHDNLGQVLTGAALQTSALAARLRQLEAPPEVVEALAQIDHAIAQARTACRTLTRSYAPPGHGAALDTLLRELADTAPRAIHVDVHAQALPPATPSRTAQELYRIAQEALNNALKHARCRRIGIALEVHDDRIVLVVEDDGRGLPPDLRAEGHGLPAMRARAARAGGVIRFERAATGGTRVVVTVARSDDEAVRPTVEGAHAAAPELLVWRPEYACGEPGIDAEHRRMFELANVLIGAAGRAPHAPETLRAFDDLIAHVTMHFEHEEAELAARRYSGLAGHMAAHRALITRAKRLRLALADGETRYAELVGYLAGEVVARHMLVADREFYPLLRRS